MANSFAVKCSGLFSAPGLLPREINVRVAQPEGIQRAPPFAGAAQERPDPRQQFVGAERFDQIIIRAGVESFDAVVNLPLGGEHENGHRVGQAAQFGADGITVQARHHDVEQDEVGVLLDGALEAGFAFGGGEDAVAFGLETILQCGAHRQLVLDDQDLCKCGASICVSIRNLRLD